jgi:hypothetical protein
MPKVIMEAPVAKLYQLQNPQGKPCGFKWLLPNMVTRLDRAGWFVLEVETVKR